MIKTNYHTHTNFCDGKTTAEKMVISAIEKKFDILGFSSHTAYPYKSSWHLNPNKHKDYVAEILRLKESYRNKLELCLGFEADYLPLVCTPDKSRFEEFNPDYVIGSVHYVVNLDAPEKKGFPQEESDIPVNCFSIDSFTEEVQQGIDLLFDGDGKKACQSYFALVREMITSFNFDIIGHLDILRKRNNQLKFFDENSQWYKNEIEATAKTISKSGKIVEINYGGIARGSLMDTYPSIDFLKKLKTFDIPITINSDAHNFNHIDTGYEIAIKNAISAGYSETQYLSKGKWHSQKIDF